MKPKDQTLEKMKASVLSHENLSLPGQFLLIESLQELRAAARKYILAERKYHKQHLAGEAGPSACLEASAAEKELALLVGINEGEYGCDI